MRTALGAHGTDACDTGRAAPDRRLHDVLGVPVVADWGSTDWDAVLRRPGPASALADELLVTRAELAERVSAFLRSVVGDGG